MFTPSKRLRPLSGIIGAGVLISSLVAFAVPASAEIPAGPCVIGPVPNNSECVLVPGEMIVLVLKGGNGGSGGDGGAGGVGGAGWDGSASVPGGALGTGGAGGAGGAGSKDQIPYVNNTGSNVTLTFTFGADGSAGIDGNDGLPGTAASPSGSPASGGAGTSGDGGFGGGAGGDSFVEIGETRIAVALGGDGGGGGDGGAGGQGGQSNGTPGTAGSNGTAGVAGADADSGLPTTNSEAPYIEITQSLLPTDDGPPVWFQSYGLGADTKCVSGWAPSWAQWVGGGRGGDVCNRYIVYRAGKWVQTTNLERGPFLPWDGK